MSKKKRQKSKAAQATAAAKAERQAQQPSSGSSGPGHTEAVEWKGGGGMMTKMRGGFQSAVSGATETKKKSSWLNTILWIAVLLMAAGFVWGGR